LSADPPTDSTLHPSVTTKQADGRSVCTVSFAAISEDDVDELIVLLARYCAESLFRTQCPGEIVTDDS
jgi:hypothetical protein